MPGSLEKIKKLFRNSVVAEKVEASTSALGMTISGAEFKWLLRFENQDFGL